MPHTSETVLYRYRYIACELTMLANVYANNDDDEFFSRIGGVI